MFFETSNTKILNLHNFEDEFEDLFLQNPSRNAAKSQDGILLG